MTTNNAINANTVTPLGITNGGTGVNAVTVLPTATTFAGWDANKNMSANNFLEGYTTTATATGTTTLTVASTHQQYFTGSLNQIIVMPVANTLILGQSWLIVNKSTGVLTVQSSGTNTIVTLNPNAQAIVTCILASGTTAASWSSNLSVVSGLVTVSNVPTGSAISLMNNTAANVTSIPVGIGTFLANGSIFINSAASSMTSAVGNVATTTAGLADSSSRFQLQPSGVGVTLGTVGLAVPPQVFTFAASGTIYLVAFAGFSSGATTAAGNLIVQQIG
jgi:hypothetical protein